MAGEITEENYFLDSLKLAQLFRVISLITSRQVRSWKNAINPGFILCEGSGLNQALFVFFFAMTIDSARDNRAYGIKRGI